MNTNKKTLVLTVFQIMLVLIAVVSIFGIYHIYQNKSNELKNYSETITKFTTQPAEKQITEEKPAVVIGADFTALTEKNNDVKAWLYIPDTGINYPIVQGEDNNIYMKRDWQKKSNYAGAAFLDARENIENSDNFIIYGHSMGKNSNIMFSQLLRYKDKEFLTSHPYIYLSFANSPIQEKQIIDGVSQPENQYRFDIIAVCEKNTSTNEVVEKYYRYDLEKDLTLYMKTVKESSLYEIESSGTPYKFVTLSTCSRPGTKNDMKLLVFGILYQETLMNQE